MAYEVCIFLSGKLAPWQILSPDLTAIYNARKKNKRATLKIRLGDKPWIGQTIELSNVRIRKHEKHGGTIGVGYTIEGWSFSAWIVVDRHGVGRGHGKLWFEGGQLTGEIYGSITVPMSVLLIQ